MLVQTREIMYVLSVICFLHIMLFLYAYIVSFILLHEICVRKNNSAIISESMCTTSSEINAKDSTSSTEILSEKASTSLNKKMPWPAFSEVFIFQPTFSKENNFAFSCKFCVGGKIIHANKSSSANLKKHINVSNIS